MLHFAVWVDGRSAPPMIAPIEFRGAPPQIARDQYGLARGGVRLPDVEVPIALNDGSANGLAGSHEPLSAEKLESLYPTHEIYVQKLEKAALAASKLGVITPAAARRYIEAAMVANVPQSHSRVISE